MLCNVLKRDGLLGFGGGEACQQQQRKEKFHSWKVTNSATCCGTEFFLKTSEITKPKELKIKIDILRDTAYIYVLAAIKVVVCPNEIHRLHYPHLRVQPSTLR